MASRVSSGGDAQPFVVVVRRVERREHRVWWAAILASFVPLHSLDVALGAGVGVPSATEGAGPWRKAAPQLQHGWGGGGAGYAKHHCAFQEVRSLARPPLPEEVSLHSRLEEPSFCDVGIGGKTTTRQVVPY